MQRSSIIATVIAAGGVLIAGSVASVAVINAASSSQSDSETIQLVAAGSTSAPSAQATAAAPSQAASAAAALPTMEASALPELPTVEQPAEQAAVVQAAPATSTKAASKPAASQKSRDDSTPSPSAESVAAVSVEQARSIVLKQGDGTGVVSTSKQSHQGYSTWAVRIARANGEELTGYVDRVSGVVVDWSVNKEATPVAQPTPSASEDDDREDDSDSEDSDSEDSDSEDDHSGSDDHDEDDD
jgi:hypothetical protein